jgi:hypothetical protein
MWVLLTYITRLLQQISLRLHKLEIWENPNISLKFELKQVPQIRLFICLTIVRLTSGER